MKQDDGTDDSQVRNLALKLGLHLDDTALKSLARLPFNQACDLIDEVRHTHVASNDVPRSISGNYTVGGATASSQHARSNIVVEEVDQGHVLWGSVVGNSDSSESNGKKEEYYDQALDGALLLADSDSGSHGSSVPSDRGAMQSRGVMTTSEAQDSGDLTHLTGVLTSPATRKDLLALRRLTRAELTGYLPLDEQGNLTSIGSINHAPGGCTPCALARREKGCKQGIYCLLCHFVHPEAVKKKSRPCKIQRVRYRKCLQRLEGDLREQGDPQHEELAAAIAASMAKRDLSVSSKDVAQKISL